MLQNKIISEETWEHAKYRVDETVAEVDRYRNEETASEADLATANLQLEQSRIVAPFSGVVGRSSARLAQQVKPSDVLFWITAEAPLRVLFTVPESVMAAFTVGKPLDLTTPIYPGLHQAGRIFRVSPVVDPASASVQVIGAVDRSIALAQAGNVHAGPSRAMNLSEALDAALPEMPRTRLARSRPPCLDPDLVVREDVLDGEPIVGVLEARQEETSSASRPCNGKLCSSLTASGRFDEIAEFCTEQTGASARLGRRAGLCREHGAGRISGTRPRRRKTWP